MSTESIINELIKNIEKRDAKAVTDMFAEDALLEEMVGTGGSSPKSPVKTKNVYAASFIEINSPFVST